MLDRHELKEIAEMRDEDACYVSLFLNVNSGRRGFCQV